MQNAEYRMKRAAIFLLFCSLAWGQRSADDLFKDANAATQKGDWSKAEFLFRELRAETPQDPRWATGLVAVRAGQHRLEEALTLARELMPLFETSPVPHIQMGSLLVTLGRPREALPEFDKVIQYGNGRISTTVYMLIADAHQQLEESPEAIAALRRAKEIDGRANPRLASLLVHKGNRAEGIAEFRAVLREDPNNAGALNNLAYAWAEQGENLDEALQYALRAVKLRPSATELADTLAWVYFKTGMLVEAEEMMMRSLQQEGGTSLTHREHLAAVMDARGDWSGDRGELRKSRWRIERGAIRSVEGVVAEMKWMAVVLLSVVGSWGQGLTDDIYQDATEAARQGDWSKAEFLFRQMRLDAPKDERWATGLVALLMEQSRFLDAVKTAREATLVFPKSPTLHLQLGLVLLQSGQADEALKEFESGLQYSDSAGLQATAYSLMGSAQRELGSLDAAIAAFRKSKAISGRPNVALAISLGERGNEEEEITEYLGVLRESPDLPVALNNLAYVWSERNEHLNEALGMALRAVESQPGDSNMVDTLGGYISGWAGWRRQSRRCWMRWCAREAIILRCGGTWRR